MKSRDGSLLRNVVYLGIGMASTAAAMAVSRLERKSRWAEGKVVVITGGSRGLGLAMAEEFGRRGASNTFCSLGRVPFTYCYFETPLGERPN